MWNNALLELESACQTEPLAWLPKESVSFNPSDSNDLQALLEKYGPEGLIEISDVLRDAASTHICEACNDAEEGLCGNN